MNISKKGFERFIAGFLTVCMLASTWQTRAIAKTNNEKPVEAVNESQKEISIIGEVTEKRGDKTKVFLRSDFSYESVIYPNSVHYFENGQWKEIDNTLTENGKNDNEQAVQNNSNKFSAKFSKSSKSNNLVTVAQGGYELSWGIEDAQNSTYSVSNTDEKELNNIIEKEANDAVKKDEKYAKKTAQEKEKAAKISIENEKKKTMPKNSSSISYKEIYPGVDFRYDLLGDRIKENILLSKAPSKDIEFSFNVSMKNLVPVLQKDKSIILFDEKDTTKAIFKMDAPVMFDSAGASSEDIEIEFTKNKDNGFKLTIKPNRQWLMDAARKFPVTIDPPIQTSLDATKIHDTYVSRGEATNRWLDPYLRVGYTPEGGMTRTFIKFDLPTLENGDMITGAQLNLAFTHPYSSGGGQINVRRPREDFNSNNIIWSTQPAFNYYVIEDYEIISDPGYDYWANWDITKLAKEWYTTGNNFGVVLEQDSQTSVYNTFYSSDNAIVAARPSVSLYYVNNSGLESYWTYHSQSAGRAGTISVNDYNGNLVLVHDDITMNGSRAPISIKHVFNSNDISNDFGCGKGWRLNISQRILPKTIGTEQFLQYIDGDGTRHYFVKDGATSTYKDQSGLNLTLTIESNGAYVIRDKKDNLLVFTSGGYLYSIRDANGQQITINYSGTKPSVVEDMSGRKVTLEYTPEGYLIGMTDPSGRKTIFGYGGTNLTSIKYPDGKTTVYQYDANNNLEYARNFDLYQLNYEYYPKFPFKVKKVTERSVSDSKLGGELNIVYGFNLTSFADVKGRKTFYQFNNSGNTINMRDEAGSALYYKYGEMASNNKMTLQSKLQKTIINYVKNHNVETSTDWTLDYFGATSAGTGSITTAEKYLGAQSLMINKTATGGNKLYTQNLTMKKDKTYTFSAYLKTKGVSSGANEGAVISVKYKDSTGALQTKNSELITGNNDWQRIETSFTIPSDAQDGTVSVSVGITGGTGTAYFDCMQLEEGPVANRYNIVENNDFSTGSLSFWNLGSGDAGDGVVADPQSNTLHPSMFDINTAKLSGVSSKKKNIYQNVNLSGKKGDNFIYSGWAKADSVPLTSGRNFELCIGLLGYDNAWQWNFESFNEDSAEWQYISGRIIADKDYKAASVYLVYYNNANTAYFDGIGLYKEEFGTSYQYDAKGNVVSSDSLNQQNTKFEYNSSNDLIKNLDVKGSQFKYEYDTKHNITKSTTSENLIYSFIYNANGSPATVTIGNNNEAFMTKAEYSANGNYIDSMTDSSGNKVTYKNNDLKGTLEYVIDPENKKTSYTYEPNTDQLLTVNKIVDTENTPSQSSTNTYGYLNDRIDSIKSDTASYKFTYDSLGNNTSVSVGGNPLVTNVYEDRISKLLYSTYGNNQTVGYDFDSLDRVTAIKYKKDASSPFEEKFRYKYDANGNTALIEDVQDKSNIVTTRNIYDTSDRIVKVLSSLGYYTKFNYDLNNNISNITQKIGNGFYSTDYMYDKDNRPVEMLFGRNPIKDDSVEYFSLNGSTTGTKGTKAVEENNFFQRSSIKSNNAGVETYTSGNTAAAIYAGTTNLIPSNSSFEDGGTGWVSTDWSSSNGAWRFVSGGLDGNQALECFNSKNDSSTGTNAVTWRAITLPSALTTSANYTLSAYAQKNGKAQPMLGLACYDSNGVRLSYENYQKNLLDNQWTRISHSFTLPAQTKSVEIILRTDVRGNDVLRFDGVQFEAKAYESPYTAKTTETSASGKLIYDLGLNSNAGSMSLWFNSYGDGVRKILSNEAAGGKLNVYIDGYKKLRAEAVDSGNISEALISDASTVTIENNIWNHLAISWRQVVVNSVTTTEYTIYINGKAITKTGQKALNLTGAKTALGSSVTTSQQINGFVEQFVYSSRVLSTQEINSLKDNGQGSSNKYSYDLLGRLASRLLVTSAGYRFETSYNYHYRDSNESGQPAKLASTRITSMNNNGNVISYTYDSKGNIKSINMGTASEIQYFYNDLNELIREDNKVLNKTITYTYDLGGNITSKNEYPLSVGVLTASLGTATKTYSYAYTNSSWKDRLESFDNKNITYDAIGNPLTYDNYTYTWENGRQLKTIVGNSKNLSFKYNDAGIRTQKIANGITTNYYLSGNKVTYEDNGTDKIYYTYDSTGHLVSMNLNGVEYYYIRNAQGDIIGLFDKTGTQVVSYVYDSWGKLISIDGSLKDTVGVKNPYRYRGYRYDTETGLYYLQSRYYNPEWGRFVNADAIVGQTGELLAHNMFAYCMNNPVNMQDDSGYMGKWLKTAAVVAGAAIAIAGIAALTLATGGMAGPVLVGAAVGGVSSFIMDAGTQYLTNGRNFGAIEWDKSIRSAAFGAVSGALGGSGEGMRAQMLGNVALSTGQSYIENPNMDLGDYLDSVENGIVSGYFGRSGAQNKPRYNGFIVKHEAPIFSQSAKSSYYSKSVTHAIIRSSKWSIINNSIKSWLFGEE